MTLEEIYRRVHGPDALPYTFQSIMAETADVDILIAPTGLGKTEAVTLGWVWRLLNARATTPKRLVWCLPMRTLVEQTARKVRLWMENLSDLFDEKHPRPDVHVVMGGIEGGDWTRKPEDPAIIVGTQDMLLSRSLMRGYGMSRFRWPVDFGLLHSDALWVYDEVQLMGAGLATSAQLEAFRRPRKKNGLSKSLWVSATLDPAWLNTAEFQTEVPDPIVVHWNTGNPPEPANLSARLDAVKLLRKADVRVDVESIKKPETYARLLAREVASAHKKATTTLVILNTVGRAQATYKALAELPLGAGMRLLLIHSRYRPPERGNLEPSLRTDDGDRIVVATQAVEAGVDMTSAVMFTELAPWSSMVQRFGRCNRAGERNGLGGATVYWIDVDSDAESALARPYEAEAMAAARHIIGSLTEVSPRRLPSPPTPRQPSAVIRPKDFDELFDTDPDLTGYDLDVSPYIRDGDDMSVSLFWRPVGSAERVAAEPPQRDELCPAPLEEAVRKWLTSKNAAVYVEDHLTRESGNWVRLDKAGKRLRPGLTLLLDVQMGGYDLHLGFVGAESAAPVTSNHAAALKKAVPELRDDAAPGTKTEDDPLLLNATEAILLETHMDDVAAIARKIADAVALPASEAKALVRAAAWHDRGKAYEPFQFLLGRSADGPLLAKSNGSVSRQQAEANGLRRYFRHELASALAFLQQHDGEPDADLIAYLIAAHHGKVRMGLRALPGERSERAELRIVRGVQDRDFLPEVRCGDEVSHPVELDLSLMELGEDQHGRPSWAARTQALLHEYGSFRLAYLEALIRIADWRDSAAKQKEASRNG
jgi:CRISPR-associated endonuclease/helicase Cas3